MVDVRTVEYQCAHCGEWNETGFDPSGGSEQRYVEDCAVCCYPLVLHLVFDPAADSITIDVEEEA